MTEHTCENGYHCISWTTDDKEAPPPEGVYTCTACGDEIEFKHGMPEFGGTELVKLFELGPLSNECPACAEKGVFNAQEDCKLGHIRWPKAQPG